MLGSRGQMAIEYLTTYAYVFIIIAVVIAALLLFLTYPKTIIPTQCTFYSGFHCIDAAFEQNSISGGSDLIILATDSQVGVIAFNSVSPFSAKIANYGSTSGSCSPAKVTSGGSFVCTALFGFKPSTQTAYTGTFSISADYCVTAPQNVSNANCAASGNFEYSGNFRTQALTANEITTSSTSTTST